MCLSCKKSIFNDILYLIHKKTHKNEVKFSEFGITKFNLVVFTISQGELVLQLSFEIKEEFTNETIQKSFLSHFSYLFSDLFNYGTISICHC